MSKQALVVGLGQFGTAVVRALVEQGVEVLAVDVDPVRVRAAAGVATEAACFDAVDAEALARASPDRRDICLCAIGDDAKDASIICTALLAQMGAPWVVARAADDVHGRILGLVGAHQVVHPDREFGRRFARRLVHRGIVAELPLGDDLVITQLVAPEAFAGRRLGALRLSKRYGITIIAVRRAGEATALGPGEETRVRSGDVLVVAAREGAVARLMERS